MFAIIQSSYYVNINSIVFVVDEFRGHLPSVERGRENSVADRGNDSRKSYMNAFLRAASPFSPSFRRKNSGANNNKDRTISDASSK
jgi:hypothetical protein